MVRFTVTACSTGRPRLRPVQKCNVRDPLWRIKDRILQALAACSIFEMASDTIPRCALPVSVTRRPARAHGGRSSPSPPERLPPLGW